MATTSQNKINLNIEPPDSKTLIEGGALSGVIAGLIMALVMMVRSAAVGNEFFMPAKLVAALFFGTGALQGGAGIIITGIVTHLIISTFLGIVFAYLTAKVRSGIDDMGWGLLFGIAAWLIMSFVVLPAANPVMGEHITTMSGPWFLVHLVFGALLGLTPYLERKVGYTSQLAHA